MIVETTRFGPVEVDEASVLMFPNGVYGFEETRKFVLVQHREDGPFKWLQALEEPALAFVVAEPFEFFPDYHALLGESDMKALELSSIQDAAVIVILVIPSDPRKTTANLLAPIVINVKRRLAKQVILEGSGYSVSQTCFIQEARSGADHAGTRP